jgi:type I restriction enzyme, S subunit
MVPKGWEKKYLKDILSGSIKNGFSPIASDKETGFWVLGLGSLGDEGINVTEIKPVEPTYRVLQTKLNHGDFLVSRSNTPDKVGRSIYFRGEVENCSYPDLMMKFRVDENKADPKFIEQKLKSSDVRAFFKNCAAGSSATMVKINKGILEKTPLLLPSINEQKKIAKILFTWDKAIATTEQLLANSKLQKKILIKQLIIGCWRFCKKNQVCTYKNTKYGRIPFDWDYIAIKDICYQVSEKNKSINDYPVLSCSKYDGFVDSLKYFNKKVYSDDISGYRVIPFGAFGFPSNHIEEGSIGLQTLYEFGLVSPIYVVFKANDKKVNNEYLYALLKTEHYRQIFSAATNASVDRRGSLRWKEFSMIHVPLPSRDEQDKIALTIKVASSEIAVIQKKLEYLKQEKKALMQQLFTGKRRVKVEPHD